MRYHFTTIRMTIINKNIHTHTHTHTHTQKIASVGEDVEKLELLCIGGGNVK